MSGLPRGWTSCALGELLLGFQAGRNLRALGRRAEVGEYGVLKISAVSWKDFNPSENKALLPGDTPKPHEIVRAGDLLISRANTTELVGAVVRVDDAHPHLMLPDKILRLRLREDLADPDFVKLALRTATARHFMEENATGTSDSMRNLSQPKIRAVPLLLAPLNEQRRIVAKIDALNERSRRAKQSLDAIPPLHDKLRKSILAAAFRGDLTREWRAQHPDVEPASVLLERIRQERRQRWEQAELEKMRAKGKEPKNDKWKAKYKEPEPVDTEGLPELPEGWCWASFDSLTTYGPSNGYSPKCGADAAGSSVLKLSATTKGKLVIDESTVKRAYESVPTTSSAWACEGDLLIQRANTLDLVGTAALYSGPSRTYVIPDLMMRVRIASPSLAALCWRWINSSTARSFLRDRATGTAGNMPKINGATIRSLPVPLPSRSETQELMSVLSRYEAAAEATTDAQRAALELHDRLSGAVLARAFRGELVPQDPTDEPADAMLERIRTSIAAVAPTPKRATKRSRKQAP